MSKPRRTLWDISALVYARTYDETAHLVDVEVLGGLKDRVEGGTVLDCGCGPGVVVRKTLAAGAAKVVGMDISDVMLGKLPEDPKVVKVHADVTPEAIAKAAADHTNGGFDLVLFKRSLYQERSVARALLTASLEATSPRGVVVVVHPETRLSRYLLDGDAKPSWAPHTLYHGFNRLLSRTLTKLKIHEYRTYSRAELVALGEEAAAAAQGGGKVELLPSEQSAFNVVALSRKGVK